MATCMEGPQGWGSPSLPRVGRTAWGSPALGQAAAIRYRTAGTEDDEKRRNQSLSGTK